MKVYDQELPVLVVDDVPATRAILRDMLWEMGFTHIAEAGDGREALDKLKKHRAQLIICDHIMKDMSGLDLVSQLGNYPYLVDIPFILVSACREVTIIDTALELGADDYIPKPVSFELFKRKVTDVAMRRAASVG